MNSREKSFPVVGAGVMIMREPDKVEGWNWYGLDALPMPLFPPVSIGLKAFRSGTVLHQF